MSDNANQNELESGLRTLWLRAQSGDEAAYREALLQIASRLRGYLRRRMQSLPDDVEDLVQETLLALHLQRGTYDASLSVGAWVIAIARHKLVDLWRRRGRRDNLHKSLDDIDEALLVAEAAARTGASPSAIKVQVHRGLKRLAQKVKD